MVIDAANQRKPFRPGVDSNIASRKIPNFISDGYDVEKINKLRHDKPHPI